MLSKLSVLRVICANRLPLVHHLSSLTSLEYYERLRQLCCTSDIAKAKLEKESSIRPRTKELDEFCLDASERCCGKNPPVLMDVECKTALILGGASGIGLETAHKFLKEGAAKVIIGDVDRKRSEDVVKKLCNIYGSERLLYLMTDIRQKSSIEMAFRELCRYVGPLDIYINCVGKYDETPQCWDSMIKTNLIGCVRGTLLAYKYFCENPPQDHCYGTVIVNVSNYGSIANIPSMPLFSAAANGINGLTSSFGQEFHFSKTRVRCVTVCPACTDTNFLKNMSRFHYDKQWASHSTAAMKCCTKQSPAVVAKAIFNAAKYGINGCVYVIKEGKYFRYAMPDYMKIMRQETILL